MRSSGYQLFSSRNFGPVNASLAMLSGLGYAQVEGFGGLFETDAQVTALRAALDETGLQMPTAHVGFDMLDAPERVLKIAKALGLRVIFAPYIDPAERPTDAAGWDAFGARLAQLGAPIWDAGLDFGWHNHDFEFQAVDGVYPIDLIAAADPRLVLELDVAWVVRAGEDPHHWITKYASRIKAFHVKDIAPAGENAAEDGWADVGHGTMDWAALIGAAEQTAAEYFFVEHDNPSDDQRFASRSIETLRGL